jgi:hypothetical protein
MEKKSNIYPLTLIILGILATLIFISLSQLNRNPKESSPMGQVSATPTPKSAIEKIDADTIKVTGVIRSSGLMDSEKEKLNIDSDYQITNLINKPAYSRGNIYGFFVITEEDISNYEGRCVSLKGGVPDAWRDIQVNDFEFNGQYTYQRAALTLKTIESLKYEDCSPYEKTSIPHEYMRPATFSGILSRLSRPAPDIGSGYDYKVKLNSPYLDKGSMTGVPTVVSSFILAPTDNNMWKVFEENIGNNVTVMGDIRWGYAESQYLYVQDLVLDNLQ